MLDMWLSGFLDNRSHVCTAKCAVHSQDQAKAEAKAEADGKLGMLCLSYTPFHMVLDVLLILAMNGAVGGAHVEMLSG